MSAGTVSTPISAFMVFVSFYKFIGMINRDIVDFSIYDIVFDIEPAKIFNPYCSSPESDSKAAPRLPTPNKTALWLERNPRILPVRQWVDQFRILLAFSRNIYIRKVFCYLSGRYIDFFAIWVEDTYDSPWFFKSLTYARYHGNLRRRVREYFVDMRKIQP